MVNNNTRLARRSVGAGHIEGGLLVGGPGSQRRVRTGRPKGSGAHHTAGGGVEDPSPRFTIADICPKWRGGVPLHGDRRGPAGLYPYWGAPVVAKSL